MPISLRNFIGKTTWLGALFHFQPKIDETSPVT